MFLETSLHTCRNTIPTRLLHTSSTPDNFGILSRKHFQIPDASLETRIIKPVDHHLLPLVQT